MSTRQRLSDQAATEEIQRFTCPTWYKVTHGPAGHRVLLSIDGPDGEWQDFHGYLNDAWLARVVARVTAQGAMPS